MGASLANTYGVTEATVYQTISTLSSISDLRSPGGVTPSDVNDSHLVHCGGDAINARPRTAAAGHALEGVRLALDVGVDEATGADTTAHGSGTDTGPSAGAGASRERPRKFPKGAIFIRALQTANELSYYIVLCYAI